MADRRPLVPMPNGQNGPISYLTEVAMRVINNTAGNPRYVFYARVDAAESDQDWQGRRIDYDSTGSLKEQLWPQNSLGNACNAFDFVFDDATTATITGITQANPGVVTTSAAHGFSDGDQVTISSVVGMTEVNFANVTDRLYTVANKTSTTFELTDEDGNNVDTSGFTAYSSGGTVKAPDWANATYS